MDDKTNGRENSNCKGKNLKIPMTQLQDPINQTLREEK